MKEEITALMMSEKNNTEKAMKNNYNFCLFVR